MVRVRVDLWASSLLAAIGLLPVASCGGNASSDDGGARNEFPCENPKPYYEGSGYFRCDSGAIVRSARVECPSSIPRAEPILHYDAEDTCQYDSDCTDAPHGYCDPGWNDPGGFARCAYGCTQD